MAIQTELLELTKCKPKANETAEVFTARVLKRVNVLADANEENWRSLSEEAQGWINQNVIAQENEQPLTLLALEVGGDVVEEPPAVEPEEQTETRPAEMVKKKEKKVKRIATEKAAPKKAAANGKDGKILGRPGKFSPAAKIKLLVKDNPHRKTAQDFKQFAKLRTGMTVQEATKATKPGYLRYAVKRELVAVAA